MNTICALDPGFGNTKVTIDGKVAVLQSAVARPRAIGMAASGLRTVEIADQVTLESGAYVAGEHAWDWGEPLGGLDYAALASEPRRALFYAGVARLLPPGSHQLELFIGLPVPLMQDESQYALVIESLRAGYKRAHAFSTPAGQYCLEIQTLRTMAQPAGAWADWFIESTPSGLRARKGGKEAEVAILDIGMNTLDLIVVRGGRVEPRYIGGAKAGVRRVLANLNGKHGLELEEIDHGLRTGALKPERVELESWMASIFGHIERVWPDLSHFDAVIPAGGGAVLLGDLLRTALVARGARVSWPANPITTNALGLWKWGSYARR
jgi:Actin like proteins N terminal domain